MPSTARPRELIMAALLPALFTPPVVSADVAAPSASEAEAAMHGTFNSGEDVTRPRNLIQLRERCERLADAQGRQPGKYFDLRFHRLSVARRGCVASAVRATGAGASSGLAGMKELAA